MYLNKPFTDNINVKQLFAVTREENIGIYIFLKNEIKNNYNRENTDETAFFFF